jgi:nitroreductase/dihydropteridine reductase
MNLIETLNWRYATKRMTGRKIPAPAMTSIMEAIRLAPSSRGLQPFKVFVIEDSELKAKIQPVAHNQHQVVESSHLLVFAAWSSVTQQQIEDFIQYAAGERGIPVEKLDEMKNVLVKDQLSMTDEQFYHWATKQIYIALGFALTAAALHEIDSAAMEGLMLLNLTNC